MSRIINELLLFVDLIWVLFDCFSGGGAAFFSEVRSKDVHFENRASGTSQGTTLLLMSFHLS